MCTVTFIPVRDNIFITSNRDEKQGRSPAISSALYALQTGYVLFPKDSHAGGTWFGVHENGNFVVLLNGGWVCHQTKPPYRKSRGLILLDLIDSEMPFHSFLAVCLHNIEPFTAIIRDDCQIFECRWDGNEKYYRQLENDHPNIWSSVTLYNDDIIDRRRDRFMEWLQKNPFPSLEDILVFHQFSKNGNEDAAMLKKGEREVCTVSITSAEISRQGACMTYLDLMKNQSSRQELIFTKTSVENR
jgi:hypothetical protein